METQLTFDFQAEAKRAKKHAYYIANKERWIGYRHNMKPGYKSWRDVPRELWPEALVPSYDALLSKEIAA